MGNRTKAVFSFSALAMACATVGCGINQQSRFQMSFLPPAAHLAATPGDNEPPPVAVPPNVYLSETPAILMNTPSMSPTKARADMLAQKAEKRFEAGRKYYQSKDIPDARREFDAAVDALLDASDQNPDDRTDYEHRLEKSGFSQRGAAEWAGGSRIETFEKTALP